MGGRPRRLWCCRGTAMLKMNCAVLCLLFAGIAGCGNSDTPGSSAVPAYTVPSPEVTGPIGTAGVRGHPLWDSFYDLADLGYDEQEYFVSGTARTYTTPSTTAPYTTRIIVRRPLDPEIGRASCRERVCQSV